MFLSLTIEKKDRVIVTQLPFQPARVEYHLCLKMLARDQRSSLFGLFVSDDKKKIYVTETWSPPIRLESEIEISKN